MYVHLGGEVVVSTRDIVGIFDARIIERSEENKRFIEKQRSLGRIIPTHNHEDVKSIVITGSWVYGSPISPGTLARRILNAAASLGV